MFGVTQEPQLQPTTQAPTTAEEEALKRNTDCVYFLASPLTCKKGSECEYRHSDIARLNPRDCWYWLNGNCLNPKCGFRHPPLDGLLGTQVPTTLGPSLPPSQAVAEPSALGPYVSGKQAVPCIYFQRGNCLKGDICPFMHAPYSVSNKVTQFAAATPVTESQPSKKAFGGLEKCSLERKVSQINVPKSVDVPLQVKQVTRIEMDPLRNGVAIKKSLPLPTSLDDEIPRYRPANVHSASNGNSVSRSNRNHKVHVPDDQNIFNDKDADEYSREPSPGFDVLVDDELRDSDYYPNEDQFGRTRGHEGRSLNPINDYEIDRSDYNSVVDVDRDMYRESRGYDSYESLQGHYGWEEHRASSERMLGGSAHLERRRNPRADNVDQIDESDLRHHLSKQKRGNGLRSVISHHHSRENHVEDLRYRASRRDHLPAQESSVSSRLQGRIKIPRRSASPVNKNDSRSERDIERARHPGRLSPERPQGRLKYRIKGRVQEDINNEKNFGGPRIRRDIDDNNAEFTGPKRLAELRVGKKSEGYEQHMSDRLSIGKRKYPMLEGAPQQVEGNMSFEGPKPLSEILKRKRGGEVAVYESGMTSANNEDNNQNEGKESFMMPIENKETKGVFSSLSNDGVNSVHGNKEESKLAASDIGGADEKLKSAEGQSSLHLESEEGMIVDEAIEDQEAEGSDQREGEYDYEQADGEDYNLDEEEYYEEDDDADDFAKKLGVMY